jgi:anti-anti-sigma factor
LTIQDLQAAQSSQLRLNGPLCIYSAQELKRTLLDALAATEQLVLEMSSVDDIDSAGLQLLALLQREAALQGKAMCLQSPSEPVRDLMQLYAMEHFFSYAPAPAPATQGDAA